MESEDLFEGFPIEKAFCRGRKCCPVVYIHRENVIIKEAGEADETGISLTRNQFSDLAAEIKQGKFDDFIQH